MNDLRNSLVPFPKTNKAGVANKVKIVAKVNPPAIVLANCVHHCEEGAPTRISLSKNFIVNANTMGKRPKIVVIAVNTTGLNLKRPALKAACGAS